MMGKDLSASVEAASRVAARASAASAAEPKVAAQVPGSGRKRRSILGREPAAPRSAGGLAIPVDRQVFPTRMAHLGCAGALGYGGMKVVWALGGTIGLSNSQRFHAIEDGLPAPQRFFDYWGTPILAGFAVVIFLGLVHSWGRAVILRPLLRILAWVGSLVGVAGVIGLILTMSGTSLATSGGNDWGSLDTGTYLFTYACFLAVGLGFGVTVWLTRGECDTLP